MAKTIHLIGMLLLVVFCSLSQCYLNQRLQPRGPSNERHLTKEDMAEFKEILLAKRCGKSYCNTLHQYCDEIMKECKECHQICHLPVDDVDRRICLLHCKGI